MHVYPVFLNDLRGRRCIVFGGGHEADKKVRGLIQCGADVVVIAPSVSDRLAQLALEKKIEWIPREYAEGDLTEAFLAIVSETNPAKTEPIWREAVRAKVLINAVDDVPHCTFVAGSVVRRGRLTLAISTSGAAPALSVRLREEFEERFGPEYEVFLEWMATLREPMARRYPDFEERRRVWYRLVDSDILALIRDRRLDEARARLDEIAGAGL